MTPGNQPAEMGPWLVLPLSKTEAGRREITARKLPLSRAARNLLLIIDPQRTAGAYLALVKGCSPLELQQLVANGLVGRVVDRPADSPAAPLAALPAAATPALPDTPTAPQPLAQPLLQPLTHMRLADALQEQGYKVLYDRLTAEERAQLGLFKGYRLILDIEKCSGPAQIRTLALQFVAQVRQAKGDAAANALAQRLADPA